MKKEMILLFVVLSMAHLMWCQGQPTSVGMEIQDVFVIPAHPTVEDSIYIVTDMLLPRRSEQISENWIRNDSVINLVECYYSSDSKGSVHVVDTVFLGVFEEGDYYLNFTAQSSLADDDCLVFDSLQTQTIFEVGLLFDFEDEQYANVHIRPNPTPDGITRISHAAAIAKVEVFARNGEKVWMGEGTGADWFDLDLLVYPAREYRIRITMRDGNVIFRRLLRTS